MEGEVDWVEGRRASPWVRRGKEKGWSHEPDLEASPPPARCCSTASDVGARVVAIQTRGLALTVVVEKIKNLEAVWGRLSRAKFSPVVLDYPQAKGAAGCRSRL